MTWQINAYCDDAIPKQITASYNYATKKLFSHYLSSDVNLTCNRLGYSASTYVYYM